jgi:hypothetical protein
MIEAEDLRDLETELSNLRNKKAQLDSEKMRHEMEMSNAKESLEASLGELKALGFTNLESAQKFIDDSVVELKELINKAKNKIEGIATEV